jgi:hypothetical protein
MNMDDSSPGRDAMPNCTGDEAGERTVKPLADRPDMPAMRPVIEKLPDLASSARRPGADYEVGYGKPPVSSRFQPGRSGNPRGRPKGSRNRKPALNEERLKTIVLEEAYRSITINEKGRQVSILMAQAVMRAMAHNAVKGHARAQRLFTELLTHTERENKRLADHWLETAIEYKVDWERELFRRHHHGITHLPDPLPHPDDIRINMRDGTVQVTGPMQKEEVAHWEKLRAMKAEQIAEVAYYEAELKKDLSSAERAGCEQELDHARDMLTIVGRVVPD